MALGTGISKINKFQSEAYVYLQSTIAFGAVILL